MTEFLLLLVGIPISVAVNLITPHLGDWLSKSNRTFAIWRLKRTIDRYEGLSELNDNPSRLYIYCWGSLFASISFLVVLLLLFYARTIAQWGVDHPYLDVGPKIPDSVVFMFYDASFVIVTYIAIWQFGRRSKMLYRLMHWSHVSEEMEDEILANLRRWEVTHEELGLSRDSPIKVNDMAENQEPQDPDPALPS